MINDTMLDNAKMLLEYCQQYHMTISTAESCTAGLITAALTHHAGSSSVVMAGFITYANMAKINMIHVDDAIIKNYGAVSQECCIAMLEGTLAQNLSNIAIAVTGVAGPGASENKPQGLVFIGCQLYNHNAYISKNNFTGNRQNIREQTVLVALQQTLQYLCNHKNNIY